MPKSNARKARIAALRAEHENIDAYNIHHPEWGVQKKSRALLDVQLEGWVAVGEEPLSDEERTRRTLALPLE